MLWTNAYNMRQVGSFVANARREKGLTQDRFAELVGVSHATISALENGKGVSTKTLERALQLLGMKLVIAPKSAVASVNVASNAALSEEAEHGRQ